MTLAGRSWQVRIPLSPADFIQLTGDFETPSDHSTVAPYADLVRRIVEPKLPSFSRRYAAVAGD